IQAILTRIAAVDPAKHLLLLARRQAAWPSGRRPRVQRFQSHTRLRGGAEPAVDRRPMKAEGSHHRRWTLAVPHPLDRHQTNGFQRPMIKTALIPSHAASRRSSTIGMSSYLPTGE